MEKKYTIRIERTETFVFDVDVNANSKEEAIAHVEEQYANGEFSGERDLYYSPADVEDNLYCIQEKEVSND